MQKEQVRPAPGAAAEEQSRVKSAEAERKTAGMGKDGKDIAQEIAGVGTEGEAKREKSKFSATIIAKIAMFSALAAVLQLIRIPMPVLFPSWLELNFADIPALIGTFALGPVSGSIIVVVKIVIKLLLQGTGSAFTGDLSDLFCGLSLVIPSGLIYKYNRTFRGALVALLVGTLSSTGVAMLANRFIIVPAYAKMFGGIDAVAGTITKLFPSVTAENFYAYYLPLSVLPFNLLRCLIASAVTLLLYKRISRLLNKF